MRTLNKNLRAAHLENKNWQQELFHFLRNYRATSHSTTGVSPAELLFGRKLVIKLPELITTAPSRPSIADTDIKQKVKMKAYADTKSKVHPHSLKVGDTVLVREQRKHKLSSPYNKIPYTITNINGTMITAANASGHSITRNCSQFKQVQIPAAHSMDDDSLEEEEINIPTPEPPEPPVEQRRYPVRQNTNIDTRVNVRIV